ncbi:uncharacterized protein FIBRA_08540 [Fibroporia radiculosa]|uniref:Amino acid transporter transmembrane domain-containing protein n=1 Tax=Fibroporia radiculosa TaxID=599839 RepID=J4H583_9APHY|nr:uncharacterized protein FIBRA_08540 [Fibroporia radiculosa]CCM06289.1 predicted protein [Fibroporia radiculosa]
MSNNPRLSSSSDDSVSGRTSPIHGFDSTAALIVVPDTEETSNSAPFDLTSEDDTDDESELQAERVQSSAIPPLSSTTVFLYLLSPFIKLGAMLVTDCTASLQVTLPALLFFAGLSAFARQIWYMLARYVRRADLEEIVLEAFARERGKEGRRLFLRFLVRFGSGLLRILLSAIYIRASTDVLVPLFPDRLVLPTYIAIILLLAVIISPFYFSPNLGISRVVYTTWASLAAFVAWIICIAYTHASSTIASNASSNSLGTLWRGLSVIPFAFTTSSTIPLYASLRGTMQPLSTRPRRSHSFKLLSVLSVGVAVLCIIPVAISQSNQRPASQDTAPEFLATMTSIFSASTLVLSVPSILILTPGIPLPFSLRRAIPLPLSKCLVYLFTIGFSLVPKSVMSILSDTLWISTFLGTYFLPAFIHIILHNFRRPLSIVVPPHTPVMTSPSSAQSDEHSDSRNDELLQRKERTLQRRRLGRRIVWDIGGSASVVELLRSERRQILRVCV